MPIIYPGVAELPSKDQMICGLLLPHTMLVFQGCDYAWENGRGGRVGPERVVANR